MPESSEIKSEVYKQKIADQAAFYKKKSGKRELSDFE